MLPPRWKAVSSPDNTKGKEKKKTKQGVRKCAFPVQPQPSPESESTTLPFSHTDTFCTLAPTPGYSHIYPSPNKEDLGALMARHMHPTAPAPQAVPAQAPGLPPPAQADGADCAQASGGVSPDSIEPEAQMALQQQQQIK